MNLQPQLFGVGVANGTVMSFLTCPIVKPFKEPQAGIAWINIQMVQQELSEFPSMYGHCG